LLLLAINAASAFGCGGGDHAPAAPACASSATPDATFTGPFDVDTGLPPSTIGAEYGQPDCKNQYLVEVDVTQIAFQGHDVVVLGRWTSALPAVPCDERTTMSVTVFDGSSWHLWDSVMYVGQADGNTCHAQTSGHIDPGSAGLDATNIPAAKAFEKARVAVGATEGDAQVAVAITGQTL
jgi:hypothetical protein